MQRRTAFLLLVTTALGVSGEGPATGNFGISTSSCWLENVLYNPPAFSTYLAEAGRGATLELSIDGARPQPLSSFFAASPPPVFPECAFAVELSPGVSLRWRAFAPLSPEEPEVGFLPLLIGSLALDVASPAAFSRNATLIYRFFCGSDDGARAACSTAGGGGGYVWLPPPLSGAANFSAGPLFVGASGGAAAGAHCGTAEPGGPPAAALCARLALVSEPGSSAGANTGVIFVGHHVPEGHYARTLPTPLDLAVHGASHAALLAAHHAALLACIPSTGWPDVDAGMRAWLQAPVLLTKGVGARVLTMGYVELNARDSFWTTAGLHAVLWPSLEAIMLRESCEFACSPGGGPPSYCRGEDHGKIPTCVLPTIVRDDNVDITAFWALRLGRYVAATGDAALLEELYPCLRAALLYLQRRAAPGEALPAARADSYWGSWLDVPFLKGRKLTPDNSAVYLAAQRVGADAAALLLAATTQGRGAGVGGRPGGHTLDAASLVADRRNFSAAYAAGWRQLTSAVSEGGQWDSEKGALVDSWWDGRPANYSLGDSFMAIHFSVLGGAHAQSLVEWITGAASGLEGPYGIRALFPYVAHAADPWGGEYPPGVYANGGTYAWLTCGTVLSLAAAGDTAGAWRVWLKLTSRMFQPGAGGLAYEYLHSDLGDRAGHAPQGWDGVCVAWAWRGGAVRWWRESSVSDVGPRGGAIGAEDPKILDDADVAVSGPHVYHLALPVYAGSGGVGQQRRNARPPLLLPILSLQRRSFARCAFDTAGGDGAEWGAPPSSCEVVSGIAGEGVGRGGARASTLAALAWQETHECERSAAGFRCAVPDGDASASEVLILLD